MSQSESRRVTPPETVHCSACGALIDPTEDTALVFLGGERDVDARVYCPDEYCVRTAREQEQ